MGWVAVASFLMTLAQVTLAADAPAARPFQAGAEPAAGLRAAPLALASSRLDAGGGAEGGEGGPPSGNARGEVTSLGGERARILLRSLTLPGWGQATLGRHTSAKAFWLAETGIWTSFVAFRVQALLRRQAYETTAGLFAGIDLHGRDEGFRRIVGLYPSSEDYNKYVVRRDAANLYYDDPVKYREYIAEHELQGQDGWAWQSPESYELYQEQRKLTRRAGLRANAMLGLAIANRLLSAVHAARYAGAAPPPSRSWNIECGPRAGDPSALALGVRVRF